MSDYIVLNLSNEQQWRDKLNKLSNSHKDIYYTPDYYSLYQHYGDGEARCFVFEDKGNLLLYPFLQNCINTIGYQLDAYYYDIQGAYGYNGVIASAYNSDFINAFHLCFDNWCQNNNVIAEFTRFNPLLNNVMLASPLMQKIYSRKTVMLNLQLTDDDIWMNQFSTKNRNVIRKAIKEGVTIVESNDYDTFRRLYNGTMENVSAEEYYFFSESYFNEFKTKFKDNSVLYLAMLDKKPIAGSIFMFSEDYAHYHLSARDKNYYKLAANNLLLWYGIRKAKERGCKWFHLGGGTTSDEKDKLFHFKSTFSHETGDFWIGKRIHNKTIYDSVISQWKERFPDQHHINRVRLLGYRDI